MLIYVVFFLLVLLGLGIYWFLQPYFVSLKESKEAADPLENEFEDTALGVKVPFPSLYGPPSISLSLIVPSYNEESRLPIMLEKTMTYLEGRQRMDRSFTFEIIVVDDGSKDKTSQVALQASAKYGADIVRLLKLRKNRGKGGAVKMGMMRARGNLLLMVDADAATEIVDLNKLEKAMADTISIEKKETVICIGSRAHLEKEAIAERHWIRNFLMHSLHFLVGLLCVRGISDTQCGFKLFTRPAALLLFPSLHIQRWAFDLELLFMARRLDFPIKEIAVKWQEIEGSKLNVIDASLQIGRDMVLIRTLYMFGLWKIKSEI